MRAGIGIDVHRLVEERPLIMGGVKIPYQKGLLGHSDADVLVHAVMDSMLGALALGDIGKYFPDTDPEWEGADSLRLLEAVYDMIRKRGYVISNIDSVIIAQKPKMAPFIDQMRENIADRTHCAVSRVGVKATTEEHMGFTGSGDGIKAVSICMLEEVI